MSSMRRHILLAEMYYLKTLLLEGRIDFLKTKFLPIIRQKLENNSQWIPQAIRASFPPNPPDTIEENFSEIDATNLFDYVLDRDPDPTKKNSQWLLTLITRKNQPMPLEDLIYAGETLAKFEQMKKDRQIPQGRTDINTYKSLSDLEAVVEGKKKEIVQAQDAEMQKAFDESEVLLNDSHAMVVIPKTQFAAMYWARPATWCTGWGDPKGRMPHRGHNHFETYNPLGPLYVIHIKPTNEWYQFHEQNKEFNDSENRYLTQHPTELAEVLKDNPDVVQAIGEEKLANAFMNILGVKFWSKETIAKMKLKNLVLLVKNREDFEALPDTAKYDPALMVDLAIQRGKQAAEIIPSQYITPEFIKELRIQSQRITAAQRAFAILNIPIKEWPPEAITYAVQTGDLTYTQYMQLPEEDRSEDQLKALVKASAARNPDVIKTYPPGLIKKLGLVVQICRDNPRVFQYLDPRDLTQEDVNAVAEHISPLHYKYIPEAFQTKAIKEKLWRGKSSSEHLHLSDVPEEFHRICAVNCLSRYPEDIPRYVHLLDDHKVAEIVEINVQAIPHLPSHFLKDNIARILEKKLGNQPFFMREFWKYFDSKYWSEPTVKWLIENAKLSFDKIPEHLRTPENLAILINNNNKVASEIPQKYWTEELLSKVVVKYSNVLKHINPAYVPENFLVRLAGTHEAGDFFFNHNLPASMKTPRVVEAFVNHGYVQINELPKNLETEINILKRIKNHPAETKDIPHAMFTKLFAFKLVKTNDDSIKHIPKSCYSEPLLYAWLSESKGQIALYTYDGRKAKEIFEKFPKSLWSSRTLALAIDQHLIAASRSIVPDSLMNKEVARAIIKRNHEDVNDLDAQLDDNDLVEALQHNWKLLLTIPPERITEPMAYSVMKKFAIEASPNSRAWYHKEDSPILAPLKALPRKVWSKRVFEEAVGYVVPLRAVPSKWRDDKMITKAVIRDPSNIKVLSDPAKWLNEHLPGHGNAEWLAKLEGAGVGYSKKKFFDITKLPREQLSSGASYAKISIGPSNIKCYFFDNKGNYVFFLTTYKGAVKMERNEIEKAQPFMKDVLEMARKALSDYNSGDLNEIGIYGDRDRFHTEEQTPKITVGDMQWSIVTHSKSNKHTAWIEVPTKKKPTEDTQPEKKYKPAISFFKTFGSGGWGRTSERITDVKFIDLPYCIAHSKDIADYINRFVHTDGGWSEFPKLGIYFDRDKTAHSIAETKIGTIGNFSIWRNSQNRIGIFGPNGMVGRGVIRASGKIDKIDLGDRWSGRGNATLLASVERMFDRISQILRRNKNATGISLEEMLRRIGRRL